MRKVVASVIIGVFLWIVLLFIHEEWRLPVNAAAFGPPPFNPFNLLVPARHARSDSTSNGHMREAVLRFVTPLPGDRVGRAHRDIRHRVWLSNRSQSPRRSTTHVLGTRQPESWSWAGPLTKVAEGLRLCGQQNRR